MGDQFVIESGQKMALMIVLIFSSLLSVFTSLLITIFYLMYASFRKNFSSQLIVAISLLDTFTWTLRIISSIYSLTHDFKTFEDTAPAFCQAFGFLFSFMNLMTFFLVLVIGLSLYCDFLYSINLGSRKKLIYSIIFLLAFAISSIDLGLHAYEKIPGDIKCWIRDYSLRLLTFYMILWIVFLLDSYFMITIIRRLKKMPVNNEVKSKLILKFSLFPIFMLITWGPSSIRRIFGINYFPFEVFIYFITPLQGFLNALAYGMINSIVKEKLIAFFLCDWEKLAATKEVIDEKSLNKSIEANSFESNVTV